MKIVAVLLDIAAIQQYVFGSNKLKENLGASYLVKNIFESYLESAIKNTNLNSTKLNEWDEKPEDVLICKTNIEMEIGYIGGGNALLFFKEKQQAVDLVTEWTKILLIKTPGLTPSIAFHEMECNALHNETEFQHEIGKLFNIMRKNKSLNQPQTIFPRHGITSECKHTGFSAELYDFDEKLYVSSVAGSKLANVDNANIDLKEKFGEIIQNYDFPVRLDELGQHEGDNYISIVHIDGNEMGKRFKSCKTLEEIRNLSRNVRRATLFSFTALLKNLIQNYELGNFDDIVSYNNNLLPLRPIIMGGDDITFVTHGKLGVYLAEIFLKEFSHQKVSDKKPLSACAGITVTGTKYPFYRGYQLAEDLCKQAKKKFREEGNSSWIDFHIAYGGFSGSIENIRIHKYQAPAGELCLRPYRVTGEKNDYQDLKKCLDGIKDIKEQKWPNSKLKDLRKALTLSRSSMEMFLKEMEFRGRKLPDISNYPEGWGNGVTPYFDMLELMEFYPKIGLNKSGGGTK